MEYWHLPTDGIPETGRKRVPADFDATVRTVAPIETDGRNQSGNRLPLWADRYVRTAMDRHRRADGGSRVSEV